MARRVSGQRAVSALRAALVLAGLWALPAMTQEMAPELARQEPVFTVLAGYTFDDQDAPPTGPDTFRVFEQVRGQVARTSTFRFSGSYAVQLSDHPGDGNFPELQGYFERRQSGQLFAHFAFLTTDPSQTFNVALAGPRWFALQNHGIAFWLENRGGTLVHVSDSIPKKLLPLQAFTWYQVDLLYDLDRGRYDLAIFQEGVVKPLVSLTDQPNATAHRGSAVDKFSFIGDRGEDTSAVVYYVDDVVIAAGTKVKPRIFVAPGRRQLFVELFGEPRQLEQRQLLCLPALTWADLGRDAPAVAGLGVEGAARLRAAARPGGAAPAAEEPLALALDAWRQGCRALGAGRAGEAASAFATAREAAPAARLFALAEVLALGRQERWTEAQARLDEQRAAWGDDPRLAAVESMLLAAAGDAEAALAVLEPHVARIEAPASHELESTEPGDALVSVPAARQVLASLLADQHYYLLTRAARYAEARDFALASAVRPGTPPAPWAERAADAQLLGGEAGRAGDAYRQLLPASGEPPATLLLKLADVAYLLGDLDQERQLRERIYGTLETP